MAAFVRESFDDVRELVHSTATNGETLVNEMYTVLYTERGARSNEFSVDPKREINLVRVLGAPMTNMGHDSFECPRNKRIDCIARPVAIFVVR